MRGNKVVVWTLTAALTLTGLMAAAAENPRRGGRKAARPRVTLTSREDGRTPKERFSCSDPVHAYIDFPKGFEGKHRLEGLWFRPDGALQDRTEFAVTFTTGAPKTAYLWLKFREKDDSVLDEFSLGGDYGATADPFTGTWTLHVRADGKLLTQKSFEVFCD